MKIIEDPGVLWERGNYHFITFTTLTLEFLEPKDS